MLDENGENIYLYGGKFHRIKYSQILANMTGKMHTKLQFDFLYL